MFYLRRFIRRIIAAYQGFTQHDGPLLAAAIAYYLAFSLFPLLLVLVAGLGWAFEFTAAGQDAHERVLAAIQQQASPALGDQIEQTLSQVSDRAATGGIVGIAVLMMTAVAIFTHVDYAFDRIWGAAISAPTGWRAKIARLLFTRLKSLLMLMGVGAFVIAVMVTSIVLTGMQSAIASAVQIDPRLQEAVQPLVHAFLNFVAFAVIYRFLPKARVGWGAAIAGGVFTAILWEVGRQILAFYLLRHDLPSAYGVIGSFMAIMLWTYYAMLVMLFGAEYVRVVNEDIE